MIMLYFGQALLPSSSNLHAFFLLFFLVVFLKRKWLYFKCTNFVSFINLLVCTSLYLMIICSMLTQKWYFCQWFNNIFEVVRIFWLRGHSKTASFAKLVFFDPFPQCHTLPFFAPPYTIFSLCHWLKSDNLRHETEETFFLYTQPAFKFTQKPSFWFFYC